MRFIWTLGFLLWASVAIGGQALDIEKLEKDAVNHYNQSIDKIELTLKSSLGLTESIAAEKLIEHAVAYFNNNDIKNNIIKHSLDMYKEDIGDPEETVKLNPITSYVNHNINSLLASARLTPGVMSDPALLRRAQVISSVAKFYSKRDQGKCRYLPNDFSLLVAIDMQWLEDSDSELVIAALKDELTSLDKIRSGRYLIGINDADDSRAFSQFAKQWFFGLDGKQKESISKARSTGNYCVLWNLLLDDVVRMSKAFPSANQKILRPLLLNSARGWMDDDLWNAKLD